MLARQRWQFIAETQTQQPNKFRPSNIPLQCLWAEIELGNPYTHIQSETLAKEEDLTLILLKSGSPFPESQLNLTDI